jgi:hypothetical protein
MAVLKYLIKNINKKLHEMTSTLDSYAIDTTRDVADLKTWQKEVDVLMGVQLSTNFDMATHLVILDSGPTPENKTQT